MSVRCCLALCWRCCWWWRDTICPLPQAFKQVTAELQCHLLVSKHTGLRHGPAQPSPWPPQNHCCMEQNLLIKEATWKAGHPEGTSPTLRSQTLTCPLSISPELFLPFQLCFLLLPPCSRLSSVTVSWASFTDLFIQDAK